MLETNKKQAKILQDALSTWQQEQLLSEEQAEQLRNSIIVQHFDWARLAKYCFVIAILCVVAAVFSVIADDFLIRFIFDVIGTEWGAVLVSLLLATGFFFWGGRKKTHSLERKFSSEALLTIGGIFVAVAIGFLGNALDTGSGHFSLLFLLGAVVYVPLAIYYQSIPLWTMMLLSISIWVGTEMAYQTNYMEKVLGISYFIWYLVWGGLLLLVHYFLKDSKPLALFSAVTYWIGLIVVFGNLWLLSLDVFASWPREQLWTGWLWAAILALASFAALVWGIKKEDFPLKVIGLSFLLLDIYTKYFQYLFEELHSAIFFSILALSFWLIGSRAEDIWSGRFWKGSEDLLDQ